MNSSTSPRFAKVHTVNVSDPTITHAQRTVLSALALHADNDGVCWPSMSTLATVCNVTRRTVRRHIAALVEAGHVEREERKRGDGSQTSNRYRIVAATAATLSDRPTDAQCPPPRTPSVLPPGRPVSSLEQTREETKEQKTTHPRFAATNQKHSRFARMMTLR